VTAQVRNLRFYIYISDYKLDMLYEQISPARRRRISGELKVDLKLAGLTLRGSEQSEATRMTKLRAVERYINKYHDVGDVSNPGQEFFRGCMEMQWGWLTPQIDKERGDCRCGQSPRCWISFGHGAVCGHGENPSPVVMFRGMKRREGEADFVLLSGSRRHVLGAGAEDDPAAVVLGGSLMSGLVMALEKYVSQLEDFSPFRSRLRDGSPGARIAVEAGMFMPMKAAPRQRLKFLAVPFGRADVELKNGILHGIVGTPIYVAYG
jgi:hypothetical protein